MLEESHAVACNRPSLVPNGKSVPNQTFACMLMSRRLTLSAGTGEVRDVDAYNIIHPHRREGHHAGRPA